jgi:superoxide dismutase, Cu-Zn family
MHRPLVLAAIPLLLAGCQTVGEIPTERVGQATLKFANGLPAGTAQFYGNASQVSVALALTGFTPGVHGLHLHTTGKCDAPEFTTAGPHLNPAGHQHGTENPQGSHLGDLPNVTIDQSGSGVVNATVLGERAAVLAALFDGDGTAIVVHAGPDDYKTDPSGNSGGRQACGVVSRT